MRQPQSKSSRVSLINLKLYFAIVLLLINNASLPSEHSENKSWIIASEVPLESVAGTPIPLGDANLSSGLRLVQVVLFNACVLGVIGLRLEVSYFIVQAGSHGILGDGANTRNFRRVGTALPKECCQAGF